jgi:hypothetical protein
VRARGRSDDAAIARRTPVAQAPTEPTRAGSATYSDSRERNGTKSLVFDTRSETPGRTTLSARRSASTCGYGSRPPNRRTFRTSGERCSMPFAERSSIDPIFLGAAVVTGARCVRLENVVTGYPAPRAR